MQLKEQHQANAHHKRASAEGTPCDVFVAFGITGDLAKVMTFQALYRLERSGRLDCPIVGVAVDDWSLDDLRQHARKAIEGTGEQVDDGIFDRLAARLSYVRGDFSDEATYSRVAEAIRGASAPVFYLEIPPFLFATVVKGLAQANLLGKARVVVEKPFGNDMPSADALNTECTSTSPRSSSIASTTSWGRWACRSSFTFASPTPSWSRFGTGTTSNPSRSPWRRASAWRTVVTSTIGSGHCATSSSTTSCS